MPRFKWNKNASRSGGTFGIAQRFAGMNNVDGWKEKLPSSYQTKEYYKYQHCLLVGVGDMEYNTIHSKPKKGKAKMNPPTPKPHHTL